MCHKRCVAAYKKRRRMNSTCKALAAAWDAMADDEKKEWYRKNTSAELEQNDDATSTHAISATSTVKSGVQVLNHGMPWSEFEQESLMKGISSSQAQLDWKKMLLDPDIKKVKYADEVLIVRFRGLHITSAVETASESRIS